MKNTKSQKPSGGPLPGVAFIHDNFPWGGAERATMDILEYLSKNGYSGHVLACTFHENLFPLEKKDCFRVEVLPERHLQRSRKDADAIVDYIRKHNIHYIISLSFLRHINYIREKTGVKYIYTLHGVPLWEIFISKTDKCNKKTLGGILKWYLIRYPKVNWLHYYQRKYFLRYRKIVRKSDCYVTLCEEYRQEIIEKLRLDRSLHGKLKAIGNSERPVDPVKMEKKKQVIYVGRLTFPDKRVDRLIEVWRMVCDKVSGWELLIVGDGEERQNLEQAAAGMTNVRFIGAVSNVQPYYDDAAVLCLTSATESWGFVLTEAQTNGVIPIAFDCSAGVHHLLAPSGTNGILVPDGDVDSYVRELTDLLNDDEKRRRMQRNVIEKARDYSMEQVGRKWLDLFSELQASGC